MTLSLQAAIRAIDTANGRIYQTPIGNLPGVNTILDATESETDREKLRQWQQRQVKQRQVKQLGEEGANQSAIAVFCGGAIVSSPFNTIPFFQFNLGYAIMKMTLEFETLMNSDQSRSTQVVLPDELYQAIEHRAKVHGCSIGSEIVTLLAQSLDTKIEPDLANEFVAWEAASDEDWLKMESLLTRQEP